MIDKIQHTLLTIRKKKPLILNLTNYVTMDLMANALLALGASPIMSLCGEELAEIIPASNAINLNIGTLDAAFIDISQNAAILAKQSQTPLILDPVGSGATTIRTKTAKSLMPYATIIRGNASEICSLANNTQQTKGVDTTETLEGVKQPAINLALALNATMVISGPTDFITDGSREKYLPFGSSLMPLVTGMGCTLTAIIAAFSAVIDDPFDASVTATLYYTLCAELAAQQTSSPGSFRTHFIDQLYACRLEKLAAIYVK